MRHYGEYYVRALLLEGVAPTDITERLQDVDLPSIPLEVCTRFVQQMSPVPSRDALFDETDEAVGSWARSHGVYSYFRDLTLFSAVISLVQNHVIRDTLQRMLLMRYTAQECAVALTRMGMDLVQPSVIEVFQHYFFNLRFMHAYEILEMFDTNPDYREAFIGGRDLHLWRTKGELPYTDDELHRIVYRELGVRVLTLRNQTHTEVSDDRVVKLAQAMSRVYRDIKSVSSLDKGRIKKELAEFDEAKDQPNIPAASLRVLNLKRRNGTDLEG